MSLRDNPVVEYLLMVQGGANTLPLNKIAAPQLVKLLEVDETELVAAVPPPRLPETEEELEPTLGGGEGGDTDVETEIESEARFRIAPNVFRDDDFMESPAFESSNDGFIPYAAAPAVANRPVQAREVRASAGSPPVEGAAAATAGLSEYAIQILSERAVREANMIEQISNVARAYRQQEGYQPTLAGTSENDRSSLIDIFTGGHIQAQRAAIQKIHSIVRGPVRRARNAFDFILANDDDVRSLFSQLVVRELTRAENLNPRTVKLRDAYVWNEEHLHGILDQFEAYDFYLDGDNNPVFTAFEREDVWDDPRGRVSGVSGGRSMTGWRKQYGGPTYNY